MILSLVLLAVLAAGLVPGVSGENTGDCSVPMEYSDTTTSVANREKSEYNANECYSKCETLSTCLSFHYSSATNFGCWLQTDANQAYVHESKSGFKNFEMPCRVPDSGEPYKVYASLGPSDSLQIYAAGTTPMACHAWCAANTNVCTGWVWIINTSPSSGCSYGILSTPTNNAPGVFTFLLTNIG